MQFVLFVFVYIETYVCVSHFYRTHFIRAYIICFVFVYCSYALKDSNINDTNFEKLSEDSIPDIILVKKFYSHDKAARRKARVWKLKHITDEVASMSTENK